MPPLTLNPTSSLFSCGGVQSGGDDVKNRFRCVISSSSSSVCRIVAAGAGTVQFRMTAGLLLLHVRRPRLAFLAGTEL